MRCEEKSFCSGLTGEKENNPNGMSYVDHHRLGIVINFDTETERK
jgi:hypothetical protein